MDRVRKFILLIRLRPFDIYTPEGRSSERHRRIFWTTVGSALATAVSIITSIITVSISLSYLGVERFGMWLLLISFKAMLVFADLGIGNGLLNLVSTAYGRDDRDNVKIQISSALAILGLISCIISIVFIVIYPMVHWDAVFNVTTEQASKEAGPTIAIFMFCSILNIPISIVSRIFDGYQEAYINSLWSVIGNITSLLFLFLFINLNTGLPFIVLALVGAPLLAQIFNGLFLFLHQKTWLKPKISFFSIKSTITILRLGSLFFILQLATSIGYESDTLLITQFIGVEAVADYAIPKRLFSMATIILGFVLSPLWPAYSEAISRKDSDWVKYIFFRSLRLSIFFGIVSAILLVSFSRLIIKMWVGEVIFPTWLLLIGLASWLILYSTLAPCAMLLNGASIVKFQVIIAIMMTTVNILCSILLVQKIGVPGPIFGTVISQIVCVLLPTIIFLKHYLKRGLP